MTVLPQTMCGTAAVLNPFAANQANRMVAS